MFGAKLIMTTKIVWMLKFRVKNQFLGKFMAVRKFSQIPISTWEPNEIVRFFSCSSHSRGTLLRFTKLPVWWKKISIFMLFRRKKPWRHFSAIGKGFDKHAVKSYEILLFLFSYWYLGHNEHERFNENFQKLVEKKHHSRKIKIFCKVSRTEKTKDTGYTTNLL